MSEDFDSGDELFNGVDPDALLRTSPQPAPAKRRNGDSELQGAVKRPRNLSSDKNDEKHLALAERLLASTFGYSSFRHEQAAAIQRILAGQNTLVVFPTGAGKSLCYQIPAVAFPELDKTDELRESEISGVTIVVSPLLALMKDQVDALQKRGVAAECIDSTKTWDQLQVIYADLRRSRLRLLYCAPERLNNEGFLETVKYIPGGIRLLAVDEAHCISEWGHSFRPDYLKVARFVDEIKAERVICLTATATPKVAEDICKAFAIESSCVFKTSPYRPNLHLHAKTVGYQTDLDFVSGTVDLNSTEVNKRFDEMSMFLIRHPGPALVYVALQEQSVIHAGILRERGFKAAAFHGGMKTEVKQKTQEDFMAGRIQIVCATIAFGMGIDKPDIRTIIHWDLSSTVEEYSQQIGRAGRDGMTSHCMFYLAPSAFYLREVFARGDLPSHSSLYNLLGDIFGQASGLSPGDVLKISHYSQCQDFDIRQNPLGIIYANLELHFGFFRAITPEYSKYTFEALPKYFSAIQRDRSPEARAIAGFADKKAKLHHLDVNLAVKSLKLNRSDVVKKLNELNETGCIKLKVSGVEHRYRILSPIPRTKAEILAVTDKLYADLQTREKDALRRGYEVMNLITGKKCFAKAIVEHFGMSLPDGKSACGHCTYCSTGASVMPPPKPNFHTTPTSIQPILKATDVRDDPRFLARVAFGIRSPRISRLGLEKKQVFRSLAHHDFDALLREFTKACDLAAQEN